MSTTPLSLTPVGGAALRALSVRLFLLAVGAWVADVVLDSRSASDVPTGKVVLSAGGQSLTGTVDPRRTGSFGPSVRARIVGGAGGWDQLVPEQDFSNPAGILSTVIYSQTADLIGETIADLAPIVFPTHFVRMNGAASRVFRDHPWWVDFTGVTNVGPRPSTTADASLLVRDYDASRAMVTFACDTLLLPNTPLTDARFNGAPIVTGDVEQVFDANGSTGWAWVASSAPQWAELANLLKAAVIEFSRAPLLRTYRYAFFSEQGAGWTLQALTPTEGVPNIIPIATGSGLAGAVNGLAVGAVVVVGFANADPTDPYIVSYSLATPPLKTTVDASVEVDVGPSAPLVALAGGKPVVDVLAKGAALTELLTALEAFAHVCASSTTDPTLVTAAGALTTALGLLPPAATTRAVAA